MKKNKLSGLVPVILAVCLIFSMGLTVYFAIEMALARKELNKSEQEIQETALVQAINYYCTYSITGHIESSKTNKVVFSSNDYYLSEAISEGIQVSNNTILAVSSSDNKNILCEEDGVITSIREQDNTVIVEISNLENLKACFYLPQEISTEFGNGDLINIKYNNKQYEAIITYASSILTINNDLGNNVPQRYYEAKLNIPDGIFVNGVFSLDLKVATAVQVKSVSKFAIEYKDDEPFVTRITQENQLQKINVALGVSNETMVEIISDEILVGDLVLVN